MISFQTLWDKAAARKGGAAALEALLPAIKTSAVLCAIPDDRWLSTLTKCVFQAGFVWKVIENKWEGFEAAFHGFDPERLANLSEGELGQLLTDTRIIRNGQKIRSVRHNAQWLLELSKAHGSAAAYFANWPGTDYVGLLEQLKQHGSRLGGFSGQVFLRAMGKDSFFMHGDVNLALIEAGVVSKNPTAKRDQAAVQAAFNAWSQESGRPLAHISRVLACGVGG